MSFYTIFKITIPVMLGFIPLGIAFGLLAENIGVAPLMTMALSLIVYAGAGQFALLSMLSAGTGLVEIFIASYVINLRHTFYSLALLKDFKGLKFKYYNIFALTDESFAIFKTLKTNSQDEKDKAYTLINLLTQTYWAVGTLLGILVGKGIRIDYSGIEFCLTALFIVLAIEMFKDDKNYKLLFFSLGLGVFATAFFPPSYMLLLSLFIGFTVIVVADRIK
ncbi:AzlC family ABC transporter permease [Campylobacter sp. MOP7]|uniref:AzlC family ABC transporter permease n=1 Tax=Campylobacter canis TaxID=3378588 RepID=UPI00387E61E9